MWAGTIAMISAANAPQLIESLHSRVSEPRHHDARTPNHAGTMQHTSLSDMGVPM